MVLVKLLMMLCFISILATNAVGQAIDEAHIDYHNPLLNGAACDSNTLQAAITAIGSNQKTLYLTATNRQKVSCVWNITTSVTIPANITLRVPFGVTANIATGVVVTANRCIRADDPAWHTGPGTVVQTATNCGDPNAVFGGATQASFVQHDCYHSTAGANAATITSCTAFIGVGSGATRIAQRIQHTAPQIMTYTGGNGHYYTIARADNTLTPAGWTCVASTPYCWILAASKPALPNDTTWLLHVVVTDNAITQSEDISYRRFTQQTSIATSMTIGREGVWDFPPHTGLTLPLGVTITNGGCIKAMPQNLFVGQGLVVFQQGATCTTVFPEWWGAVGDGVTPGQQAYFTKSSEALAESGGIIKCASATAHYKFNAQWNIKQSNVTFDGQGCLLSGAPLTEGELLPAIFVTDGGGQEVSGETSQFLHNVHLRNYRVGIDATYPQDQMRGGVLQGCVNCSIENVQVKTTRGTTFNFFRCQSCTLRNIYIEHGSDVTANFATLIVHSNNTLVENWYVKGPRANTGPCCAIFQVKGGINNRVENATIEDVTNPVAAGAKYAFWSRGDDPWSNSPTDPVANPYPFLTNPNAPAGQQDCKTNNCYLYPDSRRASADTRWTNVTVRNTPGYNCMTVQEGYGDHIVGFTASQCRIGIQFNQSPQTGARERDYLLTTFHIRDIGLESVNGDGVYGVNVNGQGAASVDGAAIAVDAFRNIRISNGVIESTAGPGLGVENASAVVITNVVAHNTALKATEQREAFSVMGPSRNVKLIGNTARDGQAVPTIHYGFRIQEQVQVPTMTDNTVDCTNCVFGTFNYYRAIPVGRYSQNSPAFCTARTVGTVPDTQRCVLLTKDGDRFRITAACAARQGTTNRGYFERTAVVEDNAGTITIHPNTGTGDVTFESDTTWDVTYAAVLEELRIRPQGGDGQTVDWWCDIHVIDMRT